MIHQKVEIRFEKGEAIRFISHHDLMRAIMRAARRAHLPVRLTEGFNPRPRIVFPVALEVGIASLDEVVEIEFSKCLPIEDIAARLSSAFPPGLTIKAVKELEAQRAGQVPTLIRYRLHLQEAGIHIPPEAPAQLLAQATLPFQRPREKHIQNVDLRPALGDIRVDEAGDLIVDVRPAARGSVRPLEVLSLLTQQPLDSLKRVRMTKVLMEMQLPKGLSAEALRERQVMLHRAAHPETETPPTPPIQPTQI
jgi:radical SAM-linked protein